MKTNLCTLFDSNYLDKGIVLYQSLENNAKNFCLYVLAMDDKCYDVLTELNFSNLEPIRLKDFENASLLKAKANRSRGEYCWTCSSSLIKYLFEQFNLDYCTYIDADMYFYQDPQILVNEMIFSGSSAQVVEHRFARNDKREWRVGTYCVQFNTFKNDKIGLQILDEWVDKCLECCSQIPDGVHWGDQKYLDPIVEKYRNRVNVLENLGGGVAPWNVSQYKYVSTIANNIVFQEKISHKMFELIFYHFEGVTYISRNKISAPTYLDTKSNRIITALYSDYLIKLERVKKMLASNYSIGYLLKEHPVQKAFKGNFSYYIKKIGEYLLNPKKLYIKYKEKRSFINI